MTPTNYNRKAATTVYPKMAKTVARKKPSLGRGKVLPTPAQSVPVPTLLTATNVPSGAQQHYPQTLQSDSPAQEHELAPAMYQPPPLSATGYLHTPSPNAVAQAARREATRSQRLDSSAISPLATNRALTPVMRGGDASPCVMDAANEDEDSEPDAEVAEDCDMD
ncbi:hypothetical protein BDV97DRAFT_401225 [Delphinella strobiligena]|nr:hypothetical protein BDV97DRAFT_401225 [Delphinella strobiligena]